jgi:hypothetical protein
MASIEPELGNRCFGLSGCESCWRRCGGVLGEPARLAVRGEVEVPIARICPLG